MTRSVTRMEISDALHISEAKRAEIIASYPPHEREARTKGIPALGSGKVYPVTEESITCEPFNIPKHWARIAGIDFGWDHPTAGIQLAWDRDSDVVYVMSAYRRSEATPLEHCASLKGWGDVYWAWPQDAYQRDKRTGGTLRQDYVDHGLNMLGKHATFPDGGNSVEAGIMQILERMQTGRLKVFSHLKDFWAEFRLYHRKDGMIVKTRDDLMDAFRYAIMMIRHAEAPDVRDAEYVQDDYDRNEATGY